MSELISSSSQPKERGLLQINNEIFVALESIVRFGNDEVAFLKQQAQASSRKRARICAHKTNEDTLHEMLIAISAESYIHPHRHVGKSESFHIVEGEADVVIFDEAGGITDIIELGAPQSGRPFFYRLSESRFHTLLISSNFLVIHEVTNGPFIKENTILASFAPPESEFEKAQEYMKHVSEQTSQFFRSSNS